MPSNISIYLHISIYIICIHTPIIIIIIIVITIIKDMPSIMHIVVIIIIIIIIITPKRRGGKGAGLHPSFETCGSSEKRPRGAPSSLKRAREPVGGLRRLSPSASIFTDGIEPLTPTREI